MCFHLGHKKIQSVNGLWFDSLGHILWKEELVNVFVNWGGSNRLFRLNHSTVLQRRKHLEASVVGLLQMLEFTYYIHNKVWGRSQENHVLIDLNWKTLDNTKQRKYVCWIFLSVLSFKPFEFKPQHIYFLPILQVLLCAHSWYTQH